MSNRPNKNPSDKTSDDENREQPSLGASGKAGIVLLAAALFNVPAILKVPETTADKMMLVIVLTMAAGGVILLLGSRQQ